MFNGVIAALFLLGIHASRKWNLPSTSQGLLLIAMLLVPLNFLAIAAFTREARPDLSTIGGEMVSLALLSTFCYLAAQITVPRWPLATAIGVIAISALQLLVRRWIGPASSMIAIRSMAGVVATIYFASHLPAVLFHRRQLDTSDDASQTNWIDAATQTWKLIGLISFAAGLCLAFLVFHSERPGMALQNVSLFGGLLAAPGLLFACTMSLTASSCKASSVFVPSTAIGAAAALLIFASIAFSWPQPAFLMLTSFVAMAVFMWVSLESKIDVGHYASTGLLAVIIVLAGHVALGNISLTVDSSQVVVEHLLSPINGMLLIVACAVAAGVSQVFRHLSRSDVAIAYLRSSGVLGSIAVVYAFVFGFTNTGDPAGLIWISAVLSASSVVAALKLERPTLLFAAWTLCAVASLQWFTFGFPIFENFLDRLVMSFLCVCTVTVIARLSLCRFGENESAALTRTWLCVSTAGPVVAAVVLFIRAALQFDAVDPSLFAWLAGILFVSSLAERSREMFAGFEIFAWAASALWIQHALISTEVIGHGMTEWLQPEHYHEQTILFACSSLVAAGIRLAVVRVDLRWPRDTGQRMSSVPGRISPIVFATSAVALILASAAYSALPGVMQELNLLQNVDLGRVVEPIARFQFTGIVHDVQHRLPWLSLATAVVATVSVFRFNNSEGETSNRTKFAIVAALGLSPFLMITQLWQSDVAVASAMRWTTSIYFLLGCVVLWTEKLWLPVLIRLRFIQPTESDRASNDIGTDLFRFVVLFAFAIVPALAMISLVGANALAYHMTDASRYASVMTVLCGVLICGLAAFVVPADRGKFLVATKQALSTLSGLGFVCVSAVVIAEVSQVLVAHPVTGPDTDSVFSRIGLAGTYVTPAVVVAIGFVGSAIRFRSESLAFCATLLTNICVTAAVLLIRKGLMSTEQWLQLGAINGIATAVCVAAWAMWRHSWTFDRAEHDKQRSLDLARVAFGIGCRFTAIVVVAITTQLFGRVTLAFSPNVAALGIGTVGAIAFAQSRLDSRRRIAAVFGPVSRLLLSTAFVVFSVTAIPSTTSPAAYVIVLCSLLLLPIVTLLPDFHRQLAIARLNQQWQSTAIAWLLLASLFAIRTTGSNSLSDWFSCGGLAVAAIVAAVIGHQVERMRFVYLGAVFFVAAANAWGAMESQFKTLQDFLRINFAAIALPAAAWAVAGHRAHWVRIQQRIEKYVRMSVFVSSGATFALSACMFAASLNSPTHSSPWIAWTNVAVCIFSVIAIAGSNVRIQHWLYLLGLAATAVYLETLSLPASDAVWAGCLALSAFGLIANYLVSRADDIRSFFANYLPYLRVIETEAASESRSHFDLFSVSAILIAAVVTLLSYSTQFTCESAALRLVTAQAVFVQAFALALLPIRRFHFGRILSLALIELAVIAFGWSWLPHDAIRTLDRIVVAAVGSAIVTFAYSFGLVKLVKEENEWTRSATRLVPWVSGLIVVLVAAVLAVEASYFVRGELVDISVPSSLAVSGTLIAVALGCVTLAIWPGRDPLSLKREQQAGYVYAAEAILAMLFAHLRMSMPWLFGGFFEQVWPLIVMGIAFLGVGIAEFAKRQGREELSKPLERSGAFLPMLPAIGVWIVPTEVNFSLLMFVTCILYAILASMRRSFGFSVLAAVAGNTGLWYLLNQQGIALLGHPQVWLIPPALCVLIAASIHRNRLTESQNASIRYGCASTIYVSSTADIFINGVADAPWLPVVLAILSIAGICIGIVFRIRAFLFLGISFLMVSLLTVVWFAAVDLDQTWIWYVSGILMGVSILALFAFFEKKRQTVLHTLEQLKEWEA
ncbi:MAG: hypothetical protein KDB27_20240 [Planctomycetales bacterium]|nr:hypothetical protein [Planctomycetales bacterium]